VLAGAVTFIVTSDSFATLGAVGTAVIVTAAGAALLLGPWVLRLWRELDSERRERIRQEERAEVAAHLHDSVLQTLALIQRRSSSPDETTQLARRQERELRAWLYGERDPAQNTLAGALEAVADGVEADHAVTVDVVTAGDCPLDDRLRAMVEATRESVVNAAKHAGVREVSVFAEVNGPVVTAYIRDRGRGFDPAAVNGDRRGIAESIKGRMERHGGTATVSSAPGDGTEVVLEMQRVGA
jgi:signal transduction histidine kinase